MLTDVYICGMSDKLLSSSPGGFIKLIRNCNKKRFELAKQFDIVIAEDKIPDVLDKIPDVLDKIPDVLDKIKDELVKIQYELERLHTQIGMIILNKLFFLKYFLYFMYY